METSVSLYDWEQREKPRIIGMSKDEPIEDEPIEKMNQG
jgi:hypothetical protein